MKVSFLIEPERNRLRSQAALDIELRAMGFTPIADRNVKRFLNLNPTREEMDYWSRRQGISLERVTEFTDGSKVQIEQTLVANGLSPSNKAACYSAA